MFRLPGGRILSRSNCGSSTGHLLQTLGLGPADDFELGLLLILARGADDHASDSNQAMDGTLTDLNLLYALPGNPALLAPQQTLADDETVQAYAKSEACVADDHLDGPKSEQDPEYNYGRSQSDQEGEGN